MILRQTGKPILKHFTYKSRLACPRDMSVSKPYCRLWRPIKGYDPLHFDLNSPNIVDPDADLKYLEDERFACQKEMASSVITSRLLFQDLYNLFNYIEHDDKNLKAFSHRIYELLLRTATEVESNFKGIMIANGYKDPKQMTDYFKVASVARLSEYKLQFTRWSSSRSFTPFAEWNSSVYVALPWYQSYNKVKHNRYKYFELANLENLMNAMAALLSILYAQIGERMDIGYSEGISVCQDVQDKLESGKFTLYAPKFPETEQYEFTWDTLKTEQEPVLKYSF